MSDQKDFILAKVDAASRLLAEARTATDAKKIADMARAAEVYASRQKASQEVIEYATSIKVDALALMGEMLKVAEKPTGGQPYQKNPTGARKEPVEPNGTLVPPPTLADLGISKKESAAAQALADVKEKAPEVYAEVRTGKTSIPEAIKTNRTDPPKPKKTKCPWSDVAAELSRAASALESMGKIQDEVQEPWKLVESLETAGRALLQRSRELRRRYGL